MGQCAVHGIPCLQLLKPSVCSVEQVEINNPDLENFEMS